MSKEPLETIERRYLEDVWNKGNLGLMKEFLTDNYVWHGPGGAELKGAEGMTQLANKIHATFPDVRYSIDFSISQGENIIYRYTGRGTFTGEFMGVAPNGNRVTWSGFIHDRFENDKIAETWEVIDMLDYYRQMGVEPPGKR